MKQTHTRRDKGRAVFLAALMVLSVFAMSVSFAGAAAAAHNPQSEVSIEDGDRLYQGQTALVQYGDLAETTDGTVDADTTVDLFNEDGDWIREYQISAGADATEELTIDTSDLDADSYTLDGEGENNVTFDLRVQTLSAEFDEEQVVEGSDAASDVTLTIDSERASFQTEVSADGLNGEDLQTIFGEDVVSVHDDYVVIEDRGDFSANLSELEPGEYEFNFDVADTDASDTATIEVNESSGASAEFDQSTYSEEAGDIVEFTVDMENTDSAQVELIEQDDNYNVTLDVNDVDGDGEVTVYFNTYLAGEDNDAAFDTADDSDDTVNIAVDENDEQLITDNTDESRLLPADFDLQLHVGEGDSREEVDVSALFLTEGSIDDVTTGIAPSDAGLDGDSSIEDITNATSEGNEVAEGDTIVFAFEASGVFGAIDVGQFEDHFNFVLEQTNDQYDDGSQLAESDYDLVEDPENDRFFVILNTDDMEAGEEYELTLEEDGSDYFDADSVNAEFSIVERMIEVTGDFNKEDQLLVPNDEEAVITGESNAAPGTDVRVQLRATGEDPFLMSQTVEVQEDGSVEAEFDLSEHQADQEFTVTMTDQNDRDVQAQVNAILTESADGDRHSVVVNVEDADGNAVSGAEITVGDQSATTDDDGKATLELAHGEYKVNASYDGVEANGKLTVDDQTPDEVTLTLGEEDVDYNEKANEDDKKDDEQKDDKKDEKKSDEKKDDNNDDEQPGSPADEQPGFGIAVALIALLAAAGIALRRQ
ncbi:BGTF surface domain-containing protein [Halalkalicoccus ordinarius]|uniref:BGTF surface domain-containing protein n=1 Tax=Halalkalicoccus ordinarius TaxID=3116651 RepID=UPI00300F5222